MNIPSRLLEDAVNEFARLPGVGKKSALRLVLHMLKQSPIDVERFSNALLRMRNEIKHCHICHSVADAQICTICADHSRDASIICVVQDIRDVMAIENTGQFRGLYHVLGGIISPMDGIGPSDLAIDGLIKRVAAGDVHEVLMALGATMEGDTTVFYLFKRLKDFNLKFTTIARGVAVGDELEYTDEITLGRSILNRTTYESYLSK